MTVDRDLLWQAYPDGCLAVRGVATVGGWLCLIGATPSRFNPAETVSLWTSGEHEGPFESGRAYYMQALKAGDLLPNVDPADVATWACLLRDLADARGLTGTSFMLIRPDNWGEPWSLMPDGFYSAVNLPVLCGDAKHWEDTQSFYPDYQHMADDPAEALVRAKIQTLRKPRVH